MSERQRGCRANPAGPWASEGRLPPRPRAGELQEASPVCAHLAVLTAGSIGCALCPWPQLAGEVIAAGTCAVLGGRAQRAEHQSRLAWHPPWPLLPEPDPGRVPTASGSWGDPHAAPAGREVGEGERALQSQRGARDAGREPASQGTGAEWEGLTSGKPQAEGLPGSAIAFPKTVALEGRSGCRSKRQLPIPPRRAFSRARRLQLLKLRPGRKLGRAARKAEAGTAPCPRPVPSAHPAATHSVEPSMMQLLAGAGPGQGQRVPGESWSRPRLWPSSWAMEEATPRMLVEWSCGGGELRSSAGRTCALPRDLLGTQQAPPPSLIASRGEPRPGW